MYKHPARKPCRLFLLWILFSVCCVQIGSEWFSKSGCAKFSHRRRRRRPADILVWVRAYGCERGAWIENFMCLIKTPYTCRRDPKRELFYGSESHIRHTRYFSCISPPTVVRAPLQCVHMELAFSVFAQREHPQEQIQPHSHCSSTPARNSLH